MTIIEIEAYLTAVRCGTISGAAEKLFITQPALSRRLRSLETELGYPLFARSQGTRALTLTEAGRAFYPIAEKLLHVWAEAKKLGPESRRKLSVASVGSVSSYLLPKVLKEFVAVEGCSLTFHNYHSAESYEYVAGGTVDIALISDDIFLREVVTAPAFQEPFVLLAGPGWQGEQAAHPSRLCPEKEIRLPWNPEFDTWHEHWFPYGDGPLVELDQMSLLEQFLSEDRFAVVPLSVAAHIAGKSPSCRVVPLKDGPEERIIYYLTRPGEKSAPLIQRFLELLGRRLDEIPGIRSFI